MFSRTPVRSIALVLAEPHRRALAGAKGRGPSRGALSLSVTAYDWQPLATVALPKKIEKWSLTSLQQRLEERAVEWSSPLATTGYCWQKAI